MGTLQTKCWIGLSLISAIGIRAMMLNKKKILSTVQRIVRGLYNLPFLGYYIDLWSLLVVSLCRFGSGHHVASGLNKCHRPQKLLKLYEYEGCPFCRKVREALSTLDLDVIIYSCPRETLKSYGYIKDSRYRSQAKQIGGKAQFPLLIDENVSDEDKDKLIMYESTQIIQYLWKTYGDKAIKPTTYILGEYKIAFTFLFCTLFFRSLPEHGVLRIPNKKPTKPLELYSFEPSPFCKKVREILTSLEINYVLRNIAKGSIKRKEFKAKYGKQISSLRKNMNMIQVPLLIDPNTGVEMFESQDIKQYLINTYQDGEFELDKLWQ